MAERRARRRLPPRPVLAALAGAAAALGQVPFSATPVALAALAALAWLCLATPDGSPRGTSAARRAAWLGFAAGTAYFAVSLHWIVEPFLIDVARHGWMAPFALILIATGFALFWAAAFGLARWAAPGGWPGALAFGAALAGVEMARSYILTGFPWALLGYVWTEGPGAQLAAFAGPFGLTLMTCLGAGAAGAFAHADRLRPAAAALALVWLVPLGAGWLLTPPPAPARPDAPLVRLVQPNAPQDEKWDPQNAAVFFLRQLDFTRAPGAPDMVIWPETALPFLYQPGLPDIEAMADAAGDATLVFGAQRLEGARAFNTLVAMVPGATPQLYDKHHLVPFGEYFPLGGLGRYLGLRGFAARDGFGYAAGPGPRLVDLGRAGRALPLICYEAIFPQDVAAAPERPDFLLQITNDAWFGTFSGPYQHLAQARMRAIEQGLPMIRVANTGVSAAIDAAGRVLAHLPLGEAGFLDHSLPPPGSPTPYAKTGDAPAAILIAFLLGSGLVLRRRAGGV